MRCATITGATVSLVPMTTSVRAAICGSALCSASSNSMLGHVEVARLRGGRRAPPAGAFPSARARGARKARACAPSGSAGTPPVPGSRRPAGPFEHQMIRRDRGASRRKPHRDPAAEGLSIRCRTFVADDLLHERQPSARQAPGIDFSRHSSACALKPGAHGTYTVCRASAAAIDRRDARPGGRMQVQDRQARCRPSDSRTGPDDKFGDVCGEHLKSFSLGQHAVAEQLHAAMRGRVRDIADLHVDVEAPVAERVACTRFICFTTLCGEPQKIEPASIISPMERSFSVVRRWMCRSPWA